jgi:hypothetical protein
MEASFLDERKLWTSRSMYVEADRKKAENLTRLADNDINPANIVHLGGSSAVIYGGEIQRALEEGTWKVRGEESHDSSSERERGSSSDNSEHMRGEESDDSNSDRECADSGSGSDDLEGHIRLSKGSMYRHNRTTKRKRRKLNRVSDSSSSSDGEAC